MLRDVRINWVHQILHIFRKNKISLTPQANLDAVFPLNVRKIFGRVWETVRVERERAPVCMDCYLQINFRNKEDIVPLILFHPKAVKMKHPHGAISLLHAL
jgi:hypothetical protein